MIRYFTNVQTPGGTKYRISIWDDEYSDDPIEFTTGPDAFTLKYLGSTETPWAAFIPSRLDFLFVVQNEDDENFIIELATDIPNRFKVVITYSSELGDGTNALYWQGFLQGEGVTLVDEAYPTFVKLTCSDISYFSDIDYKIDDAPIIGKQTLSNNVLSVLDIAGHFDFAKDGIHSFDDVLSIEMNWRGTEMPTDPGDHPAELVIIDQYTFWGYNGQGEITYKSCKDVITYLCEFFGARFFQSAGLFRFQQIDGLTESDRDFLIYDVYRDLTSSGTTSEQVTIDRVENYQNGGVFSFVPGLKEATRVHNYRRNFLEGLKASNLEPAYRVIGDIIKSPFTPPLGFRYVIKFVINYRIIDFPKRLNLPSTPGILEWSTYTDNNGVHFVPMWQMRFYANREDTDELVWYSQVAHDLDDAPYAGEGFENSSLDAYKRKIGTKNTWYDEWDRAAWRGEDDYSPEMGYFQIIDEEDVLVWQQEVVNSVPVPYSPQDRSISVELVVPSFPSTLIQKGMKDLTFEFDIFKLYNRYFKEWYETNDPDDLNDYIEWNVDSFELTLHPEGIEKNPDTGKKRKVIVPGDYRRKVELQANVLTAYDNRTWHSIQVNTGTEFVDNIQWYRRDEEDTFDLDYLSLREFAAHQQGGRRMWNGQILVMDETLPLFHTPILKNSIKYMFLQGEYSAHLGEWNNVHFFELNRNAADLTFETLKLGEGGNSSPGGSTSGGQSGDGGGTYNPPLYESATGVNGSEYEVLNFSLLNLETLTDAEINVSLWVFQDATKLTYGVGYTIDFDDNKILPTHDFEDANIELYYFL